MSFSAPRLEGTLHRVADVPRAAAFLEEHLGCRAEPGPRPGWLEVPVGWGQSLFFGPGGQPLAPISDRWMKQGYIPILRTMAVDAEADRLDTEGVGWVNRMLPYSMKGGGRLAYLLGPENHPIGIQQRLADSTREEDIVALERLQRESESRPRWLGVGWLIYQAADIVATREFIAQAFNWPMARGTDGFGYMMQIDPLTILQIAYRGIAADPGRDLFGEAVLPIIQTPHLEALRASVEANGGTAREGIEGYAALADPEGRLWLAEQVSA